MSTPAERVWKTHKHECPKCKLIWSHPGVCEAHAKSHKCPKCGTKQWLIYKGRKEAKRKFKDRHG